MQTIGKYSFGLGDRFGHQGEAQLKAVIEAARNNVQITPVWNKSNREHITIGTEPFDVRNEADTVCTAASFAEAYLVDADHINFDTVDRFIPFSDFFTIDVAAFIGKTADNKDIDAFIEMAQPFKGKIEIPGYPLTLEVSAEMIRQIALKYLYAVRIAGTIYRKIERHKGKGNFITEISMDEVASPQSPAELFFILMMISSENIPASTIAPKFSGRFNKGVDYAGDPEKFAAEFEADLLVTREAARIFNLPSGLKLSVHSGSDKFSIYPAIGRLIRKHDSGIHIKTAGTTWLEELTGLAQSGGKGLSFVKEIYIEALDKREELCAPYADVIDIRPSRLPDKEEIKNWTPEKFTAALRNIPGSLEYNPDLRQLMHVAYKLAAHRIEEFYSLIDENKDLVAECVFDNIYNRHLCRLFDLPSIPANSQNTQ